MVRFQQDLIHQIGQHRSRGVIIDVAALDVLDSFGSRTLRNIAEMARLRGADDGDRRHPAGRRVRDGRAGHGHGCGRTPRWTSRRAWRTCRPCGTAGAGRLRDRGEEDLTRDYRAAFLRYLPGRARTALTLGYELGRRAVVDGVSLLDVVQVHHTVLAEVLVDTPAEDTPALSSAAAAFLVEVLSTFDMAHRLQERPQTPRR